MHFIIDHQNLNKIKNLLLISINNSSVDKKTENILLSCETDSLNIYANNGITSCKLTIKSEDIKIFNSNEVFINSKILLSLIDNLKNHKKIEFISHENNLLEIKSEDFICSLVCIKKENYVYDTFDIDDKYRKIIFNFNDLKLINTRFREFCKLINNTINKNSLLTNINFRKKENLNNYFVTSTDSYRIIFASFEYLENNSFDFNISPHCLNHIINIFSEFEKKEIDFYYSNENFVVKQDDIFLKSKIFLGNYPDFSDWFNQEINFSFEIKKNVLLSAIDRNLFLSNNFIKTTNFSLDDDVLTIEYKDSEKGFSKERLKVINEEKQEISFSLNSLFLKQLIKNIPSENLMFKLTEPLKPIIFFGLENDGNFKQLILPMKNN